jgi:hypothetical protein
LAITLIAKQYLPFWEIYQGQRLSGEFFINYPFLQQHDPSFERLRSDARFNHLLQTVRDRWMSFEA